MNQEEPTSTHQMQPETLRYSLGLAVAQLRYNLQVVISNLIHELEGQHLPQQACLVLEPVSADNDTRDGETYLVVRYKFRLELDEPHSQASPPSSSR